MEINNKFFRLEKNTYCENKYYKSEYIDNKLFVDYETAVYHLNKMGKQLLKEDARPHAANFYTYDKNLDKIHIVNFWNGLKFTEIIGIVTYELDFEIIN